MTQPTPPAVALAAALATHDREFGKDRSPHWPAVRAVWIHTHNVCAACGAKQNLDVHHVQPFHLHPELELDPTNFITLCVDHHLLIGHLMSWSSWNSHVREDAAIWLKKIAERPMAA